MGNSSDVVVEFCINSEYLSGYAKLCYDYQIHNIIGII